jgi:hypothetical protein
MFFFVCFRNILVKFNGKGNIKAGLFKAKLQPAYTRE